MIGMLTPLTIGLVNLGLGESLRDYGEKRCVKELQERSEVEVVLQEKRQA